MSESKKCNICSKSGHFQSSKLCKGKKKEKSGKIKAAEDSDSDTETSSIGRIVEERTAQLRGSAKKNNSIVTKVGLQAWDPEGDPQEVKIKVDTDTGVRKTILNRNDWFKIKDDAVMVKTKIRFIVVWKYQKIEATEGVVHARVRARATIFPTNHTPNAIRCFLVSMKE